MPLRDYEAIVNVIAETTTATGLTDPAGCIIASIQGAAKLQSKKWEQDNIYPHKVPRRMELRHRASPHSIIGQKLANSICLLIYDPELSSTERAITPNNMAYLKLVNTDDQ